MDYLDDIDIEEFRDIPTYKRMCICILLNDHTCKYMGFALTKEENEMKSNALKKYKDINALWCLTFNHKKAPTEAGATYQKMINRELLQQQK